MFNFIEITSNILQLITDILNIKSKNRHLKIPIFREAWYYFTFFSD